MLSQRHLNKLLKENMNKLKSIGFDFKDIDVKIKIVNKKDCSGYFESEEYCYYWAQCANPGLNKYVIEISEVFNKQINDDFLIGTIMHELLHTKYYHHNKSYCKWANKVHKMYNDIDIFDEDYHKSFEKDPFEED